MHTYICIYIYMCIYIREPSPPVLRRHGCRPELQGVASSAAAPSHNNVPGTARFEPGQAVANMLHVLE